MSGPEAPIFAAAFQACPIPMALARAADQAIVAVNQALCESTGRSRESLIGRNLLENLEGGDLGGLRKALAAGTTCDATLSLTHHDGAVTPVSIAFSPVAEGEGYVLATYHLSRRADSEPTRRAADLEAALDEKTALLQELDHRVKNNLQVISSLVLLKARRTADDAVRQTLNSMADRIGALSTVHRLLHATGDASLFDLKDFVTDFAEDFAVTVDPKRIALDVEVASVSVPASKAVPLALIVHELATNAARHAFPNGRSGHVRITARREDDALRLTVGDDGIGIAAGVPNPEGFGRTLVDMLIRQMRGSIAWEECDPGTRARVTIPLDAQETSRS